MAPTNNIYLTISRSRLRFTLCILIGEGQWDVSITGFLIEELDSVQFYHDIIFCLESDSIVVSFSSSTGFLRVDFRQFWFQHITCYFLSSCFHGVLLFLSTTYERELASTRAHLIRKATKKTDKFPPLKISISIVVYKDSEG